MTLLALATVCSGCGALFQATVPTAHGANPVSSGATLTAASVPGNFPAYTCRPKRVSVRYELAVEGDQACVTFSGGIMREQGSGPPTQAERMFVVLRVDGKASTPFELKPTGRPAIGAECTARGQSDYVDWIVDAKGCVKKDALLTATSKTADLLSETGQTYATFQFAPAWGADGQGPAAKPR